MDFLKACLLAEVIGGDKKKFSWGRVVRHTWRQPHRRYLFWWRIASYLYQTGGKQNKKIARYLNKRLIRTYHTEIMLDVRIQPGLQIAHYNAIVITGHCHIGSNFSIRQNTTIGIKNQGRPACEYAINIGDNVYVGANSCIIADRINIGNNVKIGAMSFVDKDIADNSVFYQKQTSVIKKMAR